MVAVFGTIVLELTDWPSFVVGTLGAAIGLLSIITGYLMANNRRKDKLANRLHSRAAELLNAVTAAGLLVERFRLDPLQFNASKRDESQERAITAMTLLQLDMPVGHPIDKALQSLLGSVNEMGAAVEKVQRDGGSQAAVHELDDARVRFANHRLRFRSVIQQAIPPLLGKGKDLGVPPEPPNTD
jgi:hypothetical protein